MAITAYFFQLLTHLKKNKLIDINQTKSIFEIGEQNWYGDVKIEDLLSLAKDLSEESSKKELVLRLQDILDEKEIFNNSKSFSFELVKIFYRIIFNNDKYSAIDLHGTEHSIKFNLNEEFKSEDQYDVVTNIGTTEHIFNQYSVFKSIHNLTKPNGLIFHQVPGQGYYDHGFYNYQPTFFFDLAAANDYSIVGFWIYDNNKVEVIKIHTRENYQKLFSRNNHPTYYDNLVLFKKSSISNKEFNLPTQFIYSEKVNIDDLSNWDKNKK
tara:strand:- start:440 stop:1240 length:801 start_codon:yes stop_codon:yes gene_type:complete